MSWAANENNPIDITDFQGLVGGHDDADLPEGAARTAQNVRFDNGRVEPRLPLIRLASFVRADHTGPNVAGSAPFGEIFGPLLVDNAGQQYLLYVDADGKYWIHDGNEATQVDSSTQPTITRTWRVQVGNNLIAGRHQVLNLYEYTTSNSRNRMMSLAAGANHVFTPYVEPLLPKVMTNLTPSTLNSGASGMDIGVHNFGIMFRTKLGTYTKPYADPSWTVTVGGTGEAVDFTFTPGTNWQDEYDKAILILTPAGAANSRYVLLDPGGPLEVSVPTGTTTAITFSAVSISDVDLQLKPPDTEYSRFLRWTDVEAEDTAIIYGVAYGARVGYVCRNTSEPFGSTILLMSDPNLPTQISLTRHQLLIPGNATIRGCFELGGVFWVNADSGLWGFADNGREPVEWEQPIRKSTFSVMQYRSGVVVDRDQNLAFLYGSGGLRAFDGDVVSSDPIYRLTESAALIYRQLMFAGMAIDTNEKLCAVVLDDTHAILLDYSRTGQYRASHVAMEDPSTGNLLTITGVTSGLHKMLDFSRTSFEYFAPPRSTLVFTFDLSGTSASETSCVFYLLPRELRGSAGLLGDDAFGVDTPFPVDYEIANLPGPKDGADRGAVREFVYTLVRMLVQNPLAANHTVNIELIRRTGNTVSTFSLVPYTPTVINAAATWLERGAKVPGHRIGFRIHGNLVHGAFSLSRLMIYLQRRFA